MEVANHAPSLNSMTLKTALFDGKNERKWCDTVKPHRDFSWGRGSFGYKSES
jgi:hypothetical protein